jgi:hypothetical protein
MKLADSPSRGAPATIAWLAKTLQDAVDLLRNAACATPGAQPEPIERGTLPQQCLARCERQQRPPDAARTVHHFASCGGRLICKYIAAMPNVQLLSEIDPLRTMQYRHEQGPRSAPTDMLTLLRQDTRGDRQDPPVELTHQELRLVDADATERGQRLAVRDHPHSQFCYGATIPARPTLPDLLQLVLPLRSIMTVLGPVSRFISSTQNRWFQFTPPSLDDYCRRYLEFLDRHSGLPVFKYGDFMARPALVLQHICEVLDLPFNDGFDGVFEDFKLSGDSGSSGGRLAPRGPRDSETEFRAAPRASAHYRSLVDRLGYANDCSEAADASAAQ